jgi:sugar phosphate isomerase/epimerase
MKKEQIAAQLYTLRDYLKTPEEARETLKKVKEIGYLAAQISGFGPMPTEEIKKMMDEAGLVCAGTHENGLEILNHPEKVVETLNIMDTPYTAYPWPQDEKFETAEQVQTLAKRLNAAGKVLHDAGKILTYHNHHIEFRKVEGKIVLESLYELTDPRYLQGEIDTHWVQRGGGNPVAWCQKLKGRLPLLHLKDYRINNKNEIEFAEIGYGNLDWKEILTAAADSGCEWYIIEQDICPGSPFDSLKMSLDYLVKNFC